MTILVSPFARTAAIRAFPVAPTDEISKFMSAPDNPGVLAIMYPSTKSIVAPSFFIADRWRLIGLGPHAQPPGKETFAFPNLASNGPKT